MNNVNPDLRGTGKPTWHGAQRINPSYRRTEIMTMRHAHNECLSQVSWQAGLNPTEMGFNRHTGGFKANEGTVGPCVQTWYEGEAWLQPWVIHHSILGRSVCHQGMHSWEYKQGLQEQKHLFYLSVKLHIKGVTIARSNLNKSRTAIRPLLDWVNLIEFTWYVHRVTGQSEDMKLLVSSQNWDWNVHLYDPD
jgi:hypothetical protein